MDRACGERAAGGGLRGGLLARGGGSRAGCGMPASGHLCGSGHSEPRAQHSPLHPQPLRGASLGPATDLEESCFVWIFFILPSHFGHRCRKPVTRSKGKQESVSASGQAHGGVVRGMWPEAGEQGALHRGSLVGARLGAAEGRARLTASRRLCAGLLEQG